MRDIIITVCCAAVHPSAAPVQAGDGAGLKINRHVSSMCTGRESKRRRLPETVPRVYRRRGDDGEEG